MKRRILVVEDDRTLRQALTFNLGREGYEVAVAVDGEQALAAGRDPTLDLVLLDVMLPGMSGLEVLRVLRSEGDHHPGDRRSRPRATRSTGSSGLKIGADDYVAKPFSRPELLARIEAVLRRQRREVAGPRSGTRRSAPAAWPSTWGVGRRVRRREPDT